MCRQNDANNNTNQEQQQQQQRQQQVDEDGPTSSTGRTKTNLDLDDDPSTQQKQPSWPTEEQADDDDDKSIHFIKKIARCMSNIYNNWTYSYMNVIFDKGKLQQQSNDDDPQSMMIQITQHDLYDIPQNQHASILSDQFWNLYCNDKKHDCGNLFRTLWDLVAPVFVPAGVCQLVALGSQLSIPVCVQQLLKAVEDDLPTSESMKYAFIIFGLSVINAFATHRYQFLSYQSGIMLRTAVTSIIYEHSLQLSPRGRSELTSGQITNLVATDTQKLFEVMHDGHMIWSAPLAIVIVVALLLLLLGPSCFIGAAILIGLVPLSKRVAHTIVTIRKQRVDVADQRIEVITAMLQGIQVTKLNNYENQFEQRVTRIRKKEIKLIKKEQAVWGMTLVVRVFTPVVASLATFGTYVLVGPSGNNLMTASIVFTVAMLFNMLKFPINQAGQLLSKAALGYQAMQRIQEFLQRETKIQPENRSSSVPNDDNNQKFQEKEKEEEGACIEDEDDLVLKVQNGTFYVGGFVEDVNTMVEADLATAANNHNKRIKLDDSERNLEVTNHTTTSSQPTFTLSGINLEVCRGEVLAVVGEVASGKSTLIQGLLGDIESSSQTSLEMRGNVSLAGQVPFILSDTVRANILFGSPYDYDRYEKVLDACCLRPDLQIWPAGDMTEIGERGVTMSGGQKQRVSVARAVYSNPDIALFDDILSALDAGTSQRVFQNLFETVNDETGLLHNSGIVLVTHAVHVLQRVNKILVLDDGESIFYGTWDDLKVFEPQNTLHKMKLDKVRSSLQLSYNGEKEEEDVQSKEGTSTTDEKKPMESSDIVAKPTDTENGVTMTKEEREHGISSLRIWLLWFQYAGGIVFVVVQIVLMTLDRGTYVTIDWWLATWTSAIDTGITVFGIEFPSQMETQRPYLIVYSVLVAAMLVFLVARSQWAVFGGIRACERVFSTMTRRVLHAPMSYFDTTPLGRILNRFTYDVEQVDITLSQFMSIFIIACSWLVAGQVVMITIVPFMAAINAFVLFLYVLVLRHYRWSAADLQRLDAVSRSPIQASLAEGLDGSSAIRAFQKNGYFLSIFQDYINANASAMLNFVSSRRWLAVRLETLGSFVTLSACLFVSTFNDELGLSPGISGFLIIWATSMTVTLGFLINAFSEAEAAITSIERMHSLEQIPQENSMVTSENNQVSDSWPQRGHLVFDNVSLRYRPGLPLSLDGLSFTLQHGQRCAVVGRTGAGKSTLTAALFRLVEIEQGKISLDGVDLSTLGLSDVRGRKNGMFILPQDPAVFSGTIKSNLDPFSSHNDDDILNALELVRFPGINRGRMILQDTVDEGGANFSAGEKQLLCLARAMLANPKLLVLDEATSAVDKTTDEFVQQMLRTQFPDTTLLTIAHRLNTVIDYDMILVMDRGKVAEFGPPSELLTNEDGIFTAMINATGPESAEQLKRMAK